MAEVLAKPAFRRSTERGVCMLGHDPSAGCPQASLGRFQGGCRGDGCLEKQRTYYKEYRARQKAEEAQRTNGNKTKAVKVAAPTKKAPAKATPAPAKKGVKRASATSTPAPAKRGVKRRGT
jgi:hypothetical protein